MWLEILIDLSASTANGLQEVWCCVISRQYLSLMQDLSSAMIKDVTDVLQSVFCDTDVNLAAAERALISAPIN